MSKNVNQERWEKIDTNEYVSDLGVILKDSSEGNNTWVALVKEGFGLRICGKGFTKVREAMTAAEEAAKVKNNPLPPIRFPARIFS